MRYLFEIREEIASAQADLEEIKYMTDEEVCDRYKVDSRDEILEMIDDELYALEVEYEGVQYYRNY